jgi:hypothetical protein
MAGTKGERKGGVVSPSENEFGGMDSNINSAPCIISLDTIGIGAAVGTVGNRSEMNHIVTIGPEFERAIALYHQCLCSGLHCIAVSEVGPIGAW